MDITDPQWIHRIHRLASHAAGMSNRAKRGQRLQDKQGRIVCGDQSQSAQGHCSQTAETVERILGHEDREGIDKIDHKARMLPERF